MNLNPMTPHPGGGREVKLKKEVKVKPMVEPMLKAVLKVLSIIFSGIKVLSIMARTGDIIPGERGY